jgi:hypothetical protein
VLKIDVLNYFGGVSDTAKALRMHENSVRRWPDKLSKIMAQRVERESKGSLLTDESLKKGLKPRFDWDRYIENAKYHDVMFYSGFYGGLPYIPSMFSPDKKKIYLTTVDIAYDVDNIEMILKQMDMLIDDYKREFDRIKSCCEWSFKKMFLIELDYIMLVTALSNNYNLPEDYKYAKYYLKKALLPCL